MRSIKLLFAVIVVSVTLSLGVARADERSNALDQEATQLYQQVLSPFCPGRSLNDCPSSKASELKDDIRAQLEAGKSGDEILQGVFQRFGEEYRAVPKFAGVGVLVWLVPGSFVILGLLLAIKISTSARRAQRSVDAHPQPAQRLSPEDERRVQEELARLE